MGYFSKLIKLSVELLFGSLTSSRGKLTHHASRQEKQKIFIISAYCIIAYAGSFMSLVILILTHSCNDYRVLEQGQYTGHILWGLRKRKLSVIIILSLPLADCGYGCQKYLVRLLTYLPGSTISKVPLTPQLLYETGKTAARMDKILQKVIVTSYWNIKIIHIV